jgi:cell division protein FtsI/penicillin-binding protein 2
MGSSTKPLWAAAVLKLHPELDQKLQVQGADSEEEEVFGRTIEGGTWSVVPRGVVNLERYLFKSDNRYQVRLGFLGLADRDKNGIMNDGRETSSGKESLAGANFQAWHRFPRFRREIEFSYQNPENLRELGGTPLARKLKAYFGANTRRSVEEKEPEFRDHRYSFWTKDLNDDVLQRSQTGEEMRPAITQLFAYTSPQAVDFAFELIRYPRQYVSMLLGGETNLWSNVDFAGAFATAVTGHPVIPHINGEKGELSGLEHRELFPSIAAKLRPGLEKVLTAEGTAGGFGGDKVLNRIATLPRVKAYAKTGTLRDDERTARGSESEWTSRITVALIRWKDEKAGEVDRGLVLSLFVERAQIGDASFWMSGFIEKNFDALKSYLTLEGEH